MLYDSLTAMPEISPHVRPSAWHRPGGLMLDGALGQGTLNGLTAGAQSTAASSAVTHLPHLDEQVCNILRLENKD